MPNCKPEMKTPTGLLINGEWQKRDTTLPVINPYDRSTICTVATADPDDVKAATASAQTGFAQMRQLPAHARADLLFRAADLLTQRAEHFTDTIIAEASKPRSNTQAEFNWGFETVRGSGKRGD